ncbi:MAG: 2-(3-amino-3-carboxypropyl)histidine synthase [Candidatus Woesearchaeota archaeon]|nr:2-(3-amino-3-carboxypropyl)histidine synthase [Candidatus Woesearchaeota archaeon]
MKVLYLEFPYKGRFLLPKRIIESLPDSLAIVTTTQYIHQLDSIVASLKKQGKSVFVPDVYGSVYKGQILGCSIAKIKGSFDAFLYIGEGKFHPLGLLFNSEKDVYCFNPMNKSLNILGKKEREDLIKKSNARKSLFLKSKNIGILFSIKPGQFSHLPIKSLEEKFPEKTFYPLIGDNIDEASLEDFSFIDSFINTACPRISIDSSSNKIIDIQEVEELITQSK